MILVDSSVWVEGLRRDGKVEIKLLLGKLLENNLVATCEPVKLEILGASRKTERKALDAYFFDIHSLQTDEDIWDDAINLSRSLMDKGYKVPWNDILISSIAKASNVPIYTLDKHFQLIKKINKVNLLFSVKIK